MFLLTLTLVATLMHGYLFWRLATLRMFRETPAQQRLWVFAAVLWLCYLVGIFAGHDGGGGGMALLERLAMDWFGLLFITTVVLLPLDLLTGFGLWWHDLARRLRPLCLGVAILLVGFAVVQGGRAPQVSAYEVALPGLPAQRDGTRIAVLSDLHLGSQLRAPWLAARITQVEALHPDLILLLGDLFEGHGEPDPALAPTLQHLQAPLGIYAVTGNHELHGDMAAITRLTTPAGIVWLHGQWREVAPGLVLAGIDSSNLHREEGRRVTVDMAALLQGAPPGGRILLSHAPLQAQQAAAAGIGLMLSGHTHGGQIWPFGYLVGYYFRYLAGRFDIDGMSLIVSRGTGLWGPRMRLWQTGEILLVTLRSPLRVK